ncbi:MAG TPA: TetR/AcrR family transcriptional regulator [Aquabacterium sp.]|nr:TetR/AcrR family transcriptional regulator [Aquabacterium sp.]
MPPKKPRRTFDRILDVTLVMFNRFGEPNVSTSQLCGELGISPGNLFYHHPTRDALIHGLFLRYQAALLSTPSAPAPAPAPGESEPDTAWLSQVSPALRSLADQAAHLARAAWAYRFLFRDLSDLVSRHRELEEALPRLLRQQGATLLAELKQQAWAEPGVSEAQLKLWVGPMLATLTGAMGLDGALDPRERLRGTDDDVIDRRVTLSLGLIAQALNAQDRQHLNDHLSRGDHLGSDPWWLDPVDG